MHIYDETATFSSIKTKQNTHSRILRRRWERIRRQVSITTASASTGNPPVRLVQWGHPHHVPLWAYGPESGPAESSSCWDDILACKQVEVGRLKWKAITKRWGVCVYIMNAYIDSVTPENIPSNLCHAEHT